MALCDNLEVIGEGSYRVVYRQGNVVYKVEYDEGITAHANEFEWENYKGFHSLPANVLIPDMELYHVDGIPVIAAEYIDGTAMGDCESSCYGDECIGACLPIELEHDLFEYDLCYGNVIFDGGTYWIVDV